MSATLHVVTVGAGPRVVLVHGSAADHSTWSIQLASNMRDRYTLLALDRRTDITSIEDHADDAVGVLGTDASPALIVGSSFGAVVALDAVRRYPDKFAGAVLIEPPMASTEEPTAEQRTLLAGFDARRAEAGDEAAAELFLRTVLGDVAYERMPRAYQDRSKAKAPQIRADCAALLAYRPRYAELRSLTTPMQLLGGERSAPYFRPTLDAIAAHVPRAQLEVIAGAGHMLHAEAHRKFADVLARFAASVGL